MLKVIGLLSTKPFSLSVDGGSTVSGLVRRRDAMPTRRRDMGRCLTAVSGVVLVNLKAFLKSFWLDRMLALRGAEGSEKSSFCDNPSIASAATLVSGRCRLGVSPVDRVDLSRALAILVIGEAPTSFSLEILFLTSCREFSTSLMGERITKPRLQRDMIRFGSLTRSLGRI